MAGLLSLDELFESRHFDGEIIVLCVRWYLRYRYAGVVRLANHGRAWQPPDHDELAQSLPWLPLSSRDHRAGYLALSLLQPEPARRRDDPGCSRCGGQLRNR